MPRMIYRYKTLGRVEIAVDPLRYLFCTAIRFVISPAKYVKTIMRIPEFIAKPATNDARAKVKQRLGRYVKWSIGVLKIIRQCRILGGQRE